MTAVSLAEMGRHQRCRRCLAAAAEASLVDTVVDSCRDIPLDQVAHRTGPRSEARSLVEVHPAEDTAAAVGASPVGAAVDSQLVAEGSRRCVEARQDIRHHAALLLAEDSCHLEEGMHRPDSRRYSGEHMHPVVACPVDAGVRRTKQLLAADSRRLVGACHRVLLVASPDFAEVDRLDMAPQDILVEAGSRLRIYKYITKINFKNIIEQLDEENQGGEYSVIAEYKYENNI